MNKTPKKKMGKRARRELDVSARRAWQVSPVTRLVPSKKLYSRKKRRADDDPGPAFPTASQSPREMV